MLSRISAVVLALIFSSAAPVHAQTEASAVGTVAAGRYRMQAELTGFATVVVERNALKGLPLHKLDLRASKDFKLTGKMKVTGIAEVFNVFNHANYGNYQALVNTSTYTLPVQNSANTYLPRSGQFAFKVAF